MHLFITGTDTSVGKTYVTAGVVRALRRQGVDAVGFKPLCCGSRDDAEILHAASGEALALNEVNPVWFRAPVAPYAAAMIENRTVDLDLVRETYRRLRERHAAVLVEGVGGWLVPVQGSLTMGDLAAEWELPVLIVAANRLGVLNHAALTVKAVQAAGLHCLGIVLNDAQPDRPPDDDQVLARTTNRAVLEEWLRLRVPEVSAGQADLGALVSALWETVIL